MDAETLIANSRLSISLASNSDAQDAVKRSIYFDELCDFYLNVQLQGEEQLTEKQAKHLLTSPALHLIAELAYIAESGTTSQTASTGLSLVLPRTPLPRPVISEADEDSKYVTARVVSNWPAALHGEPIVEQDESGCWTASWEFGSKISYPSVPVSTPLLAITCNVTFKKGLDPSLDDLFLPEEPPATPRKRSSAPPIPLKRPITPPQSEYAKANSGPSSPSKPLPRPDKLAGAKERNRRVEEEEYQFMEEIDLLEGLDLDETFAPALAGATTFIPSSRLPPTTIASQIGFGAFRPAEPDHAKTHRTRKSFSHGIPAESLPAIRKSQRTVLKANSALQVRMRTVELNLQSTSSLASPMQASDVIVSVEVENNPAGGAGFEVDSVELDLGISPVLGSRAGKKQPLELGPKMLPLKLQNGEQSNFLFSLDSADLFLDRSEASSGAKQRAKESQPTPIDAMRNPSQRFSHRKTDSVASNSSARTAGNVSELRKEISILVKGRAIRRSPEGGVEYLTSAFESRWNCAIDLASLSHKQEEQDIAANSLARSNRQQAAKSRPDSLASDKRVSSWFGSATGDDTLQGAGNKRYTMSSLASLWSDTPSTPTTSDYPLSQESPGRSISVAGSRDQLNRPSRPSSMIGSFERRTASLPIPPKQLQQISEYEASSPISDSPLPTPALPPHLASRPSVDYADPLRSSSPVQSDLQPSPIRPSFDGRKSGTAPIRRKVAPPIRLGSGIKRKAALRDSEDGGVLVSIDLIPLRRNAAPSPPTFAHNTPQAASAGMFKNPSSSSMCRLSSTMEESDLEPAVHELVRAGSHVKLLDVFLLEVFIMNHSSDIRTFTIGVPHRRTNEARNEEAKQEFPGLAHTSENTAGVVALENDVQIGPLLPATCQSIRMRFLALQPGVFPIAEMSLRDLNSGHETRLRNVAYVVVDHE